MKRIKLVIIGILIIAAMIVSGDLYQDYLRHFEYTFDNTSLNLPFKVNGEEMTAEIIATANKYNVQFFTVTRTFEGLIKENVCIFYSDERLLKTISEVCSVNKKEYRSIFFGKTNITTKPFEESSNELLTGTYYLIGDKDNEKNFKLDLIEKYGGGLIKDGYNPNDDKIFVGIIWLAVLIVFMLLTVFEYHFSLQSNAIMISMGVSSKTLLFKNIGTDFVFLIAVFLASRLILSQFTNVSFNASFQLCFLTSAIIIDFIIFRKLYKLNLGLYLRGKNTQFGFLIGCYITKFVTSALVIASLASCVAIVSEFSLYASQKDFWDKYRSYNNIEARIVSDDIEKAEEKSKLLDYKLYSDHFNDADIVLMSHIADKDFFGSDVIAYNRNAGEYLKSILKDIDFDTLQDNQVYAFIPQLLFKNGFGYANTEVLNEISDKFIDWSGSYHDGTKIIYYDNNIKLLSLSSDSSFSSRYYKNPIVLFVNIDEEINPRVNTGDMNISAGSYFKMYNMSKQEYKNYYESCTSLGDDVQVFYFNVGEQYNHHLSVLKKSVYISLVVTALVLVLNIIISVIFLKIYLNIRSIETALKKIFGYSLLSRYSVLIIGIIAVEVLSVIGMGIIGATLKLYALAYIIAGGVVFVLLDLATTSLIIEHAEKQRILKILKGGSL